LPPILKIMHMARSGALVAKRTARPRTLVCVGPIRYIGHNELYADIANLKASLQGVDAAEASMTASRLRTSSSTTRTTITTRMMVALGEAMRVEYLAITDAGFILQIDDPRMATHYNRQVDASVDDCRKFIALRVETLNHALRGIPEDHVRFHTCYSVNIAPRVHDFELKHFVDLMLKVRAGDLRHGESALKQLSMS
jgi:5-methyltetrahydropteroyltriglutamate--homocysteine methyltransferase